MALTLENCTLHSNSAEHGGGILCEGLVSADLKRTIIDSGLFGGAIACSEADPGPALVCCDVYNNTGGDWVGCIEDQYGAAGNISLDPLFCDPGHENFNLSSASPCLPANNVCGILIGAHDVGCAAPAEFDVTGPTPQDEPTMENSPNPFNPSTTITYSLVERGPVTLAIYNAAGQLIRTLVKEEQSPRVQGFAVLWDGRSNQGQPVASGMYFYRLTTSDRVLTKKMLLLK